MSVTLRAKVAVLGACAFLDAWILTLELFVFPFAGAHGSPDERRSPQVVELWVRRR